MALGTAYRLFTGCITLALLLFGTAGMAQAPVDTLELREVEVQATRLTEHAAGTKVQRFDSAAMHRHHTADLATLLALESPVFIKSYGPGSLATTTLRGGSANHTAVVWNGINLNNPMHGQLDLSLLPVAMLDEVALQYGGSSALWGSGAVGGAIHLNSVPRFGSGLQVQGGLHAGSFGQYGQDLRVAMGTARSHTRVGIQHATALNNFRFHEPTPAGFQERTRSNAAVKRHGIIAEQYFKPSLAQQLGFRYWYQGADRGIPPTLLQAEGTARQVDGAHRMMADWQGSKGRWTGHVRSAWCHEELDWHASREEAPALSRSGLWVTEVEAVHRSAPGRSLTLGANHTLAWAQSDGLPERVQQPRQAAFGMYRLRSRNGRILGSAALRQEWLDGRPVPTTGSVGVEQRLFRWASLKAHAARVYRIPTLNDMFWRPGGNPDLLPEQGYTTDLGAMLGHVHGDVELRAEVTAFHRLMDHWIIWLPGANFWSPRNLLQVWSRGLESDVEVRWQHSGLRYSVGAITSHVVSTNQRASGPNDRSVDKQLIYVPMYSGNLRFTVAHARGSLTVAGTYTGYRYTSTDNLSFLPPFWLMNAAASYQMYHRDRWRMEVFVQGHNLLNTTYEVMQSRPMPLRNAMAGVRFHFHQPRAAAPILP